MNPQDLPQADQEARDSYLRNRWELLSNKLSALPVAEWKGEILELHKYMGNWFAEKKFDAFKTAPSNPSPQIIIQYRHELIELTKSIPAINVHLDRYDPEFDAQCVAVMIRAFETRMDELMEAKNAHAKP